MGIILALSAAFFFGLSNVYVSRGNITNGINTIEGLLLTIITNNIVNILLLPFIFLFTSLPEFSWIGISSFIGAGFFTSFLGRILLFSSIFLIGASRSGSFKITAPLFTILIAVFILKEQINVLHLIGVLVILMGVVVVIKETQQRLKAADLLDNASDVVKENYELSINDVNSKLINAKKAGIFIAILSGLSFGIGNILRKVGVTNYANPLLGGVINSVASLVFLIIVIYINPLRSIIDIEVNFNNIFKRKGSREYILAGFSTSCALYSLYFSLSLLEVSIVNTIVSIEALFTIIIGALLLKNKELISRELIVGSVIIIAGVGIITLF